MRTKQERRATESEGSDINLSDYKFCNHLSLYQIYIRESGSSMVERLFLAVPRGCLRFVIVVFPDHTH